MEIVLIIIISYFLGSIPTAYLVGRIFGKVDIRTVGSGNVGASNVFRAVGKTAGISVLIVDILKGLLPICLVRYLGYDMLTMIGAGLGAIIGHVWTIFLKFKGGKGVATGLGVFLGLAPVPVLIILSVFIIVVALSKYISVGSIIGAILLPLLLFFFEKEKILIIFGTVVALLIIIKHLPNIKRLMTGQEHKFKTSVQPSGISNQVKS